METQVSPVGLGRSKVSPLMKVADVQNGAAVDNRASENDASECRDSTEARKHVNSTTVTSDVTSGGKLLEQMQTIHQMVMVPRNEKRFSWKYHFFETIYMIIRGFLIMATVVLVTFVLLRMDSQVENLLGPYMANKDWKGVDLMFTVFWSGITGRLCNVSAIAMNVGWKKAAKVAAVLIPGVSISYPLLCYFCYAVINDRQFLLSPFQAMLVNFLSLEIPQLALLLLTHGFNEHFCKRALLWTLEPLTSAMIANFCGFYMLLQIWSEETSEILNIFTMSVGYPAMHFLLRNRQIAWARKVSKKNARQDPIGAQMSLMPLLLALEIIFQLPGFVVLLHSASATTFYNAITISVLLETFEMYCLLKYAEFKGKRVLDWGAYCQNLDQAELVALLIGVFLEAMAPDIRQSALELFQKATYAILLQVVLIHFLRVRLCFRFGYEYRINKVTMSKTLLLLYLLFALTGVGTCSFGRQTTIYVSVKGTIL